MKHFTSKGNRSGGMASGFSLIELLVVVAILALLAGIGINTLAGSSNKGVDRAGNTLSNLAQFAHQHAASANTLTMLVIAPRSEAGETQDMVSVWSVDKDMKATQIERWMVLPTTVKTTSVNTGLPGFAPTGVTYKGATVTTYDRVWFYPDGRVGDGNTVPTVSLAPANGSNANSYSLVFNPVIGTHKVLRL